MYICILYTVFHVHAHTNESKMFTCTQFFTDHDVRVKYSPSEWEYNTAVCASAIATTWGATARFSWEICVCGKSRANSDGSSLPHYTKNISDNSQQDNNTTADIVSYFQLYPASLVPSYIYLFSFYSFFDIYSPAPAWYDCDLCLITENVWPEIGLFHNVT